jgi:3-hydroxyisobutyrate dehydrogenase-like beta-hydroxyacid dehydrogenase
MTRVGFIGLGGMGMPMASRLRAGGFGVTYFARRPAVMEAADGLGARRAATPGEVSEASDVVIACVFDDTQLLEVCLGVNGVVEGLRAGATLISHTTGSPATVQLLATEAATRGAEVVDAAVSGTPADIEAGRLTVLAGCTTEVLDRVRPVLAAYAQPIVHVGAVGDAQRVKLVNNAIFTANMALVADAARVAGELGLDPASALAAIEACSGDSYALRAVIMVGSVAQAREASLPYLRKDVTAVERLAVDAGVDLGLLGSTARRFGDQ